VVPILQNKGDKIMQTVNLMNSALKDLDLEPMTIVEDDPMYSRTPQREHSAFVSFLARTTLCVIGGFLFWRC
jgi:hypothetical protein